MHCSVVHEIIVSSKDCIYIAQFKKEFTLADYTQDLVPGFRAANEAYMAEVLALSHRLIRLLALSLHLPATHFDPFFERPFVALRPLHYGAVKSEPTKGIFGCGAFHSSAPLSNTYIQQTMAITLTFVIVLQERTGTKVLPGFDFSRNQDCKLVDTASQRLWYANGADDGYEPWAPDQPRRQMDPCQP